MYSPKYRREGRRKPGRFCATAITVVESGHLRPADEAPLAIRPITDPHFGSAAGNLPPEFFDNIGRQNLIFSTHQADPRDFYFPAINCLTSSPKVLGASTQEMCAALSVTRLDCGIAIAISLARSGGVDGSYRPAMTRTGQEILGNSGNREDAAKTSQHPA